MHDSRPDSVEPYFLALSGMFSFLPTTPLCTPATLQIHPAGSTASGLHAFSWKEAESSTRPQRDFVSNTVGQGTSKALRMLLADRLEWILRYEWCSCNPPRR